MSKSLQLHISTPCQENWQHMSLADKGRFCASCQKQVIDFTQSSDRQVAEVFKKEGNVCGRFLKSQLERDLVIPKEKNRLWMAASAAVVAFLGLGNASVFAQTEKAEMVQVENDEELTAEKYLRVNTAISGTVFDDTGIELPGVVVTVIGDSNREPVQTDIQGNFSIETEIGGILEFKTVGFEIQKVLIKSTTERIVIKMEGVELLGDVVIVRNHNFAGRVLHRIGNIFRKKYN